MPETGGVNRSPGDVDDDFAEFVRARQHQMLRAAYLLCGEPDEARRLTQEAFVELALHWRRTRDESPDTFVRCALYRRAMSLRHSGSDATPLLAGLTSKQRAATVLVHFEGRADHEAAEILGVSIGAVRNQARAGDGLAGVLRDAVESVVEQDFVDGAKAGARSRKLHRRRVGVGAATAVALVAAALVLVPRGSPADRALPAPAPSSPAPSALATTDRQGLSPFALLDSVAQIGPDAGGVRALPNIDDLTRSQLALPEVLTFGPDTVIPSLSDVGNNSAPVRAVLLRQTPDGMRPVLVRPTLSTPFMTVDSLTLALNVDEAGTSSEPLEVAAVANDRRHVMFLQPGKVLVLDAFSGDVTTVAVADVHLHDGGWTADGASVIVRSNTKQWRIVPASGAAYRLGEVGASPGRHKVVVDADGETRVLEFDASGNNTRTIGGPRLLSRVWGTTFTNADSRIATATFLNRPTQLLANNVRPVKALQGIFAVDSDGRTSARLLLAPGTDGSANGCCEVLGWAFNDQVLIRWYGRDLLAWNVDTGALSRVSTLPEPAQGSPLGRAGLTVALAP